jgi:hypothetical protein
MQDPTQNLTQNSQHRSLVNYIGPAMMTSIAGTLNHLSDAMVMSVSATPQDAI